MTIDQALAAFDVLFTRAKADHAARLGAMGKTASEAPQIILVSFPCRGTSGPLPKSKNENRQPKDIPAKEDTPRGKTARSSVNDAECLHAALAKIVHPREPRLIGLRMLMEHFNKVRGRVRTIHDRMDLVGIVRRSGLTYEGARYGFPAIVNDEKLHEFLRREAA